MVHSLLRYATDPPIDHCVTRRSPGLPCLSTLEERETAAQLSDFDDYEIGLDAEADADDDDALESDEK